MSIGIKKPRLIALVGPTASGKTALSIRIARFLNSNAAKKRFGIAGSEIISADSRQVYRGMDIGTGKITRKEMGGIPHHLLDVASPTKNFTVTNYQRLAKRAIKAILAKHKIPIICGGTGFYIDAALYDYALPEVKANPKLRRMLEMRSAEELFKRLEQLDPERAKYIDRHNKRRLIRALEIIDATKKPVPSREEALRKESAYDILKIGVALTPEKLKENIHKRLLARMRQGMVAEVRRLKAQGVSSHRLENLGLEYRFVNRYLDDRLTKLQMLGELEKAIRQYTKRQMTWFRPDMHTHWITKKNEAIKIIDGFLE